MVDVPDVIDEDALSPEFRREAMRDWIAYLFPELLEPLSFGRAANKSYTVEEITAFVAEAAKDHGLKSAERLAPWHYDESEIPGTDNVEAIFRTDNKKLVAHKFAKVNKRFVNIAKDLGFFQEPYSYAFDTTRVTWDKEEAGVHPVSKDEETADMDIWWFAIAGVVDLKGRFAFGVNFIDDRAQVPQHLERLLRNVAEEVELGRVMVDSGLYGGDAVRACRKVAGRNWMIRGRHDVNNEDRDSAMGRLLDETPEDESDWEKDIDFSDVTPPTNAIVVPTREEDNFRGSHVGFLTDLDPEEVEIPNRYWGYRKRAGIEDTIRRLKHEFGVRSKHRTISIRLYLFNFANLFFNIHTLMNRALCPQTAVPLDVTFDEVLQAIVDHVFTPHRSLEDY